MYCATGVASPGVMHVVVDRDAGGDQAADDDQGDDDRQDDGPDPAPAPGAQRAAAVAATRRPRSGRRRWEEGSPRRPRRRSRQGRTYSKGERRCCHGCRPRPPRRARRRRRHRWPATVGTPALARRGLGDPDPGVQAAALGALARLGELTADDVAAALASGPAGAAPPRRRRRAGGAGPGLALGAARAPSPARSTTRTRWSSSARPGSWPSVATGRPCRPWPRPRPGTTTPAAARRPSPRSAPSATRPGCPPCSPRSGDKPTVRRRATVALAGFDDPRVEPALRAAAGDRDWQVRQAAEELLDEPDPALGPGSVVLGEEPLQAGRRTPGRRRRPGPRTRAACRPGAPGRRWRRPGAGSCRAAARRRRSGGSPRT